MGYIFISTPRIRDELDVGDRLLAALPLRAGVVLLLRGVGHEHVPLRNTRLLPLGEEVVNEVAAHFFFSATKA